jgi:hypothetical protein
MSRGIADALVRVRCAATGEGALQTYRVWWILVRDVGVALMIWRARVTTTPEGPTAQKAVAEKPWVRRARPMAGPMAWPLKLSLAGRDQQDVVFLPADAQNVENVWSLAGAANPALGPPPAPVPAAAATGTSVGG